MNGERIFALLEQARHRQASDVHIEPRLGTAFRIFTGIHRVPGLAVDAGEIDAFVESTVDRLSRARLEKLGLADAVYADERIGAIRIHASRGKFGTRLAVRLLARSIPDLESLRLPRIVDGFADLRSGLLLVAGPTGAGKSTTIASLIDRLAATSRKHVITLEDPVEYTFTWSSSIVTQYEIGRDVGSFSDGVRGALRADPDVLFIGELRDSETVAACLQAAETGHVVYAGVHTPSETPHAINRLIGLFPSDDQQGVRVRLADALRAIVGLRLLPLRDGSGLRAAAEIVIANDAVRRLIRDGNIHQLRNAIATSRKDGMQTLEMHLSELVAAGDIDPVAARMTSLYPDEVRDAPSSAFRR